MNNQTSTNDVLELLSDWRRLTQDEQDAITHNDWPRVAQDQQQKQELRQLIIQAIPPAGSARLTASGNECAFNSVVLELVSMEQRNRELLSHKQRLLRSESQQLNQTARNLKSVKRAYGTADQHHWHSYS